MGKKIGKQQNAPQRGGHGGHQDSGHVPVLLKEAIDFLEIRRGGTYIDCTVGLGGHSFEIAKRLGAQGHLIGFDKDPKALEIARERLQAPAERAGEWPQVTLVPTRGADSVFRRKDRWTCGWTRVPR